MKRGDFVMFEYLVEHGVVIPSVEMNGSNEVSRMLHRRQIWIDQIKLLAHRWRIPFIAIRTIHEYVVGFNWSAVREAF